METVTASQVKDVATEKGFNRIGHHKCCMCGYSTGYVIDGDRVAFDAGCNCTGRYSSRPASFNDIAETFNMQTPEIRARMWDDFRNGKPLID